MIKNLVFILTLALGIKVCNAQIKHKMFVGLNNTGQFRLNIIPIALDTTCSDIVYDSVCEAMHSNKNILSYVDSLPGGLFHAKAYHVLFKGDSTHLAMQITEGTYLFHTRYTVTYYWRNGNIKIVRYFTKHLREYWECRYHSNGTIWKTGWFTPYARNNRVEVKKRTWHYFDNDGNLEMVERYKSDKMGTVKYFKTFDPPKHTLTTTLNPKHPKGQPYVIQ